MDLAYVEKLANDNNGKKCRLDIQDLIDRTLKEMKTKDSNETLSVFLTLITTKNWPKKISVDKGTKFAREFKKLYKAGGIQTCSTIIETKIAFAERTTRTRKMAAYHCRENYGYKYNHNMIQFHTTLNSGKIIR